MRVLIVVALTESESHYVARASKRERARKRDLKNKGTQKSFERQKASKKHISSSSNFVLCVLQRFLLLSSLIFAFSFLIVTDPI